MRYAQGAHHFHAILFQTAQQGRFSLETLAQGVHGLDLATFILTERGLDLDFFLTHFRDDEGGKIKAMYSLSKRFKAESALLCRLGADGMQVVRTLGIPHFSGSSITYRDGGDSLTDLVATPAVVLFRSIPVLTSLLGQPCVDPAVAKLAVWVPVIYENTLAYVIFGYSQLVDLPRYLADYIQNLPIEKSEA